MATDRDKFVVGTSGWSFDDWVGPFYPPGTDKRRMLEHYVRRFETVEVNYTYYRLPTARTMESLAARSPEHFDFWVKANQETTHKGNREVAAPFMDALAPLRDAGKLAGVLLQFPQSFHRTAANRKYLAAALGDLADLPLAVEFRHASWRHPSVLESLQARDATLVVPDAPDIRSLFHHPPAASSRTGYLRLHSRNADKWYGGGAERYDYDYSRDELTELLDRWQPLADQVDRVYTFFNNCHRGQAAANAEEFRRILGQID